MSTLEAALRGGAVVVLHLRIVVHARNARVFMRGDAGMKLMASMWTIPIALCLLGSAFADELTTPGDAKNLGFSAARLARIAPWYQARFDAVPPSDSLLPGAVVAIAKGGKLAYLQAIGFQDRAKTIPMKTNSIFWIASMSKPVTSVAAMILVDEGKLDLDAPVARYLPELGEMRVAVEKMDTATGQKQYEIGLTEPPKRPMTVRDLLRHTLDRLVDSPMPERKRPQRRESRPPRQCGPTSGSRRAGQARRGSDGGLADPRIRGGQGDAARGNIKQRVHRRRRRSHPDRLRQGCGR
jgi:beta-lactamase family protein